MVWIGLTGNGRVSGPHFVNRNLNSREYLRIIRYNVVQREFAALEINPENVWWQQDGAPAHASNQSMQYLRGHFPGKVTSIDFFFRFFPLGLPQDQDLGHATKYAACNC